MGELTYSQYLGTIVGLDKARMAVINADPKLKAKFDAGTPEQRIEMFDSKFQLAATNLFTAFENHQNATQRLAVSICQIVRVVNSTLDECATTLETALGKVHSRGYMSKLFHGGALLIDRPEYAAIKDFEKISEIARIPRERLDEVSKTVNFVAATRDQVREISAREQGKESPVKVVSKSQKCAKILRSLTDLFNSINDDMDFKEEQELIAFIENGVKMVEAMLAKDKAAQAALVKAGLATKAS